jgi:3-hydroxyacyl-CoA dehydrogenase
VSDFQSIDRTWMITLQSGVGPCGMMDRMGLGVVYHVAKLISETTPNTQALESARYLDEHFIQKGRLGSRAVGASTATRIRRSPSPGSSNHQAAKGLRGHHLPPSQD